MTDTMKIPEHLQGMTQAKWNALTPQQRRDMQSHQSLTTQLIGLEGKRVEVITHYGETRRFWVGKSTGWVPVHLEVKTTRSMGGYPAERSYKSIKVLREGRA